MNRRDFVKSNGDVDYAAYASFLEKENASLKKQLDYLRSGEYFNQLRFERDLLQNVVDNGEISKEDKKFINMTRRNTELLEQLQQNQKAIDECAELVNQWKCFCNRNYEEEPYDNISIQNNIYWKDCVEHLNYLLEKLQQAKGGCDDELN